MATTGPRLYLAADGAPLVVCDLPQQLLGVGLLLLVLPALPLQLLELQVLEALGLRLQRLAVLPHNTHRPRRSITAARRVAVDDSVLVLNKRGCVSFFFLFKTCHSSNHNSNVQTHTEQSCRVADY